MRFVKFSATQVAAPRTLQVPTGCSPTYTYAHAHTCKSAHTHTDVCMFVGAANLLAKMTTK